MVCVIELETQINEVVEVHISYCAFDINVIDVDFSYLATQGFQLVHVIFLEHVLFFLNVNGG